MKKYYTSLSWYSNKNEYRAGIHDSKTMALLKEKVIPTSKLEKYYRMSTKKRIEYVLGK